MYGISIMISVILISQVRNRNIGRCISRKCCIIVLLDVTLLRDCREHTQVMSNQHGVVRRRAIYILTWHSLFLRTTSLLRALGFCLVRLPRDECGCFYLGLCNVSHGWWLLGTA